MKFNKKLIFVTLTAVMLFWMGYVGQASAVTIYDEGVSGDAPAPLGSVNLGVLGLGTNTVIGSLPTGDLDGYGFTVAVGTIVDDMILANFVGPGGSFDFSPGKGFSGFPAVGVGDIGTDLLDIVQVVNPLSSGSYTFQIRTGTTVNPAYTIDIVVSSVPEPATMTLLGIGLVGLVGGAARRKLKKKAVDKS